MTCIEKVILDFLKNTMFIFSAFKRFINIVLEEKSKLKQDIIWLISRLKKFWKLSFLCMVGEAFLVTLIGVAPIVSMRLIEALINKAQSHIIYRNLVFFTLVWILQPIMWYTVNILAINLNENIKEKLRNDCFESFVFSSTTNFFQTSSIGTMITRMTEDTEEVGNFIQNLILNFAKNLFIASISMIVMLLMSPILTSTFIVIFGILSLFILKKSNQLSELQNELQRIIDKINSFLPNIIRNIITIRVCSAQTIINERFQTMNKEIKKKSIKLFKNLTLISMYAAAITVLIIVIIYTGGSIYILNGKGSVGTLVALTMYFQNFVGAVNELFDNGIEFKRILPLVIRLNEIIKQNNIKDFRHSLGSEEHINSILSCYGKCTLSVKNVWFRYPDSNNYVLRGVNFSAEEDKIIAIVGESGAGKTTLLKLLLGIYSPECGEITVCDKNISQIGYDYWWKLVSYIPQDIDLIYGLSIEENIKLGNAYVLKNEIEDVCQWLKIGRKIHNLPSGYNTLYAEDISFSGGEKQRIVIARELLKGAKLFIFDEPTSWLDEENERRFFEMIQKLKKGRIIILVSHKKNIFEYADIIYILEEGVLKPM